MLKFSPEFIKDGRVVRAARSPSGLIYSATSGERWLGIGASVDALLVDMLGQIEMRQDQSHTDRDIAAWLDWAWS